MRYYLSNKFSIRHTAAVVLMVFISFLISFQLPVNAANTFPHIYELVSINNVNGQGLNQPAAFGSNLTHGGNVSFDGSKILFETSSTNLADSPSTGIKAGYIRDMNTNVVSRVNKSQLGVLADGNSDFHAMSETGRYVAFRSDSTNLLDSTTLSNNHRVYIKDMQTGYVQLVTPSINASDPNHVSTWPTSISNDGRLVVMRTKTLNQLVPGSRSTSGVWDSVLFDSTNNSWVIPYQATNGTLQNQTTVSSAASCDGSFLLINSYATNLVSNYSGSNQHVFMVDIRNGLKTIDLTPGATAYSYAHSISCNGRYILYTTSDRNHISPTPLGMAAGSQAVRYDRITGERMYIGSNSSNTDFSGGSAMSITDQGDVVLTYKTAPSSVTFNFKHLSDGSGTLESVQHSPNLFQGNGSYAVASGNGRYVVVISKDSNALGIAGSQDATGNSIHNVIRIKTGL